ncbi:hypothetical protein [Microbispora triticiradicis]|uniref:hypothetical protein n=1 Tax=Microbispora triticiradicis TaxID=2200763 RepID=UPI001AD6A8B6|nr:hypothetical protein [Microbispora triticiradicis]MBO4272387.1 hypothetical protein [Microbispora triticiradicis]
MSYDLGAVVPLSVTITNPAGQAEDATAVHLTITLPDGTAETHGPIGSTSPGVYDYDYATVQAGLHQVRWVATGTNASAFTDVFDVAPAAGAIVSLADARAHLNLTSATDDAELMEMIRAVTVVVERHAGAILRRPYTEEHRGGYAIALQHTPVVSITSTEGALPGVPVLDPADLTVDSVSGVARQSSGQWIAGPLRVTYVAGRAEVPPNVRLAALIILQHLWESQRGTAVPAFGAEEPWNPGLGFAIPRRALELLGTPLPGIA